MLRMLLFISKTHGAVITIMMTDYHPTCSSGNCTVPVTSASQHSCGIFADFGGLQMSEVTYLSALWASTRVIIVVTSGLSVH